MILKEELWWKRCWNNRICCFYLNSGILLEYMFQCIFSACFYVDEAIITFFVCKNCMICTLIVVIRLLFIHVYTHFYEHF